jgi:competence protein ComEC
MFAWAAQWLAGWLWRRSARLCLWLPAPRVALWAGVAAALGYALFSGWGVPAQRTVWMLTTLALLRGLGLLWPWPLALLAAAVVVTAIDPWSIAQAGFWLSFAAVGLLMASGARRRGDAPGAGRARRLREGLGEGLRGQWVATLGLAPLSLLFFQQISPVGLLANLLAIPLISFLITPLALAGSLLPALWDLAALLLRALMAWLRWLDGWAWAVWQLPVAPAWAQVAGLLGGALLVLPLPARLRLCGLGLLLPLLWPAPPRPVDGEFELLAADIGQGTAVLLRSRGHALLFDAGPQYGPEIDAGQRVLLPLLRALGVQRLDMLVLSHRDSDHVGGAASLLAGLPIDRLVSSLEAGHPLLQAAGPVRLQRCAVGQHWDWDGVRFELLRPPAEAYGQQLKSNALSCVLRVASASGRVALLTGDIEAAQELALVEAAGAQDGLRSDLLLVPHHGSRTSSSEALLEAVAPQLAFAQAGYRNRFGHPALPVLARYQAQGIALLTSPDCGALRWASVDGGWQCQRQIGRRYWQGLPAIGQPAMAGPPADDDQGF